MLPHAILIDHVLEGHDPLLGLGAGPVDLDGQLGHELSHAQTAVQLEHGAQRPHHREHEQALQVAIGVLL